MRRVDGVSVVLGTFNGERHIRAQLDSIAAQTVSPVEIVIGDDRSQDRTVDLVREFASRTEVPVRWGVNEDRLGFAENFLRTALLARGRLIAFADQDDVWLPDKLATARASLSDPGRTLWISGWKVVDEDLAPLPGHRFHTGFVERTAVANPLGVISGSRLVFRAELLDYFPPSDRSVSLNGDGPASHDEWVSFAARVIGDIAIDRTPRMLYRRHAAATTADNPGGPSRRFMLSRAGEASLSFWENAASERAGFLRARIGLTDNQEIRLRMHSAAALYERMVPRLARRAELHAATSRRARSRNFLTSVATGDYRPLRAGGLGLWAMAQDLFSLGDSV